MKAGQNNKYDITKSGSLAQVWVLTISKGRPSIRDVSISQGGQGSKICQICKRRGKIVLKKLPREGGRGQKLLKFANVLNGWSLTSTKVVDKLDSLTPQDLQCTYNIPGKIMCAAPQPYPIPLSSSLLYLPPCHYAHFYQISSEQLFLLVFLL